MHSIRIAGHTDRGPRENLEDAFAALRLSLPLLSTPNEVTVVMTKDGVGGNNYGEVASGTAVNSTSSYITACLAPAGVPGRSASFEPDSILEILRNSLVMANDDILQLVEQQPHLKGMSTTSVCGIIFGDQLYVGWVGDSSCIVCNGSRVRKVTRDHSEVRRLLDAGLISRKEAQYHPLRHAINRFLGQPTDFSPETTSCRLSDGDIVLLATDGLTDVLADEQIADHISEYRKGRYGFRELPKRLVQHALDAGTTDNVTVLCCEYHADSKPSGRTLTGAYPAAAAEAIRNFHKELANV